MKYSSQNSNKNIVTALLLTSILVFCSLLLCCITRYMNRGIYQFMPIVLLLYFLIGDIILHHIAWVQAKPMRRRLFQGILFIVAILLLILF